MKQQSTETDRQLRHYVAIVGQGNKKRDLCRFYSAATQANAGRHNIRKVAVPLLLAAVVVLCVLLVPSPENSSAPAISYLPVYAFSSSVDNSQTAVDRETTSLQLWAASSPAYAGQLPPLLPKIQCTRMTVYSMTAEGGLVGIYAELVSADSFVSSLTVRSVQDGYCIPGMPPLSSFEGRVVYGGVTFMYDMTRIGEANRWRIYMPYEGGGCFLLTDAASSENILSVLSAVFG